MMDLLTHPLVLLFLSAILVPAGVGAVRWPIKVTKRLNAAEAKHADLAEGLAQTNVVMDKKIDKLDQRLVDLTDFLLREMPRRHE